MGTQVYRAWAPSLPSTSFVGRADDLAGLDELLEQHELVTIVGPGGAGKTRLSVEVARRVEEHFGGRVVFVDLAPASGDEAARAAIEAVEADDEKQTLVIVDNCEHVAETAAEAIVALLASAPVTVIATSRVRLGLPQEVVHTLGPLLATDASRLFCERAVLVGVHEEPGPAVDAVCERLDHLPLAVELAAARSRTFTPEELANHLDDVPLLGSAPSPGRPERHRTLRAAVEWSLSLLGDDDRRAFRRLGVFSGSTDRSAVLAVLTAPPGGLDRLPASEALDRLVEGSLVQTARRDDTTWFRLPFAIRAVARERLAASADEAAVREALLEWLQDLTASIGRGAPFDVAAYERLDPAVDDLRAALSWAAEQGRRTPVVRLAGRLSRWWHVRGQIVEGRRWLELARSLDDETDDGDTVRVRNGLGNLAQMAGDLAAAREHYQDCLVVRRRIGAALGIATTLNDIGTCFLAEGDLDGASAALEEALLLYRTEGDRWGEACAHLNLGIVVRQRGDLDGAADLIAASVAGFAELGDALNALVGRVNIASIDLARERWSAAAAVLGPALADAAAANALALLPPCLESAAIAAVGLDHPLKAAHLLGAADARRSEQGQARTTDEVVETDALRGRLAELLGAAVAHAAVSEGAALGLSEVISLVEEDVAEDVAEQTFPTEPRASLVMRLAREGDIWAIGPPGEEQRLRASKGLTYLARLLAQPEKEFHVLDLAGSSVELAGGTGPVLDDAGRHALHERWRDLQEDLAEAERYGDGERAARIEHELDDLTHAVAASVGLGGRSRADGDPAERARKAVTNRLRDAVHRISANDPRLGRHLESAVRTGTYCVYAPDRSISWVIEP